jgi:modulator of drug activity B
MKNVLIINAHQYYENYSEGKLNNTLVELAKKQLELKGYSIKTSIIDKGYDIEDEVDKHAWADIIITQSPVFWFGTPWIHKKYMDEVFNSGLVQKKLIVTDGRTSSDKSKQYGTGGNMYGKKFVLSLSWNAPKECFGDINQVLYSGKSVDDAFVAITTTYKFCGCEILESFSCFDVIKNPDIENDIIRYKEFLTKL